MIRETIATLAQKKNTVKDVQGVLRHSRTATTADVYMQEIPASVQAMVNSSHRELKAKSKPSTGGCNAAPLQRAIDGRGPQSSIGYRRWSVISRAALTYRMRPSA